jgi:hypothetical protein
MFWPLGVKRFSTTPITTGTREDVIPKMAP